MKISNNTIKLFQDSCRGILQGKNDEVKSKIFLPKGTILPITIDAATKEVIIDFENGVEKKLTEDMYFDANSASVALQLQLRARDPQRYRVLERNLYGTVDVPETFGKCAAGQETYSWRILDRAGQAMLSEGNSSVPFVELNGEEFIYKNKEYHLGYMLTNKELMSSLFSGVPLTFEKEDAVMRGFAEKQNTLVYFGEQKNKETGLLNNPNCIAGQVAQGASTSRSWTQKTGAEILKDILDRASAMNLASQGRIMPDTLLVPMQYREILAKPYDDDNSSNITIGDMIMESMATAHEGKEFKIYYRNELYGGYTGGLNMFVLYEKDPMFLEFITAQRPTFIAPQYVDLSVKHLASAYWVGTVIRYPLAISYGYEI